MDDYSKIDSMDGDTADLGHLLFGSHSPVTLQICLKPVDHSAESFSVLDPFEIITFGVGRRYYLAKMNVGQGFSEQYILLNIDKAQGNINTSDDLSLLLSFKSNKKVPTPKVIVFDSPNKIEGHLPAFYCSKTHRFFNIPCTICSTNLQSSREDGVLYCPLCESLQSQGKSARYAFYELVPEEQGNGEAIIMLEDVFSEYAKSDCSSAVFPCAGCSYADSCFPEANANYAAVANENHFIIPFFLDSFFVYGFTYHPLGLIDYCELVSGRSTVDFLDKLASNKEYGRHRVISELDVFMKDSKNDYLTVSNPDVKLILVTKLRVLMRVCESLKCLGKEVDVSTFNLADINMDLLQLSLAGDSLMRGEVGFILPAVSKSALVDDILPKKFSDILFFMFFINSKNNEWDVRQAADILIDRVNCLGFQLSQISAELLNDIISHSESLSTVFGIHHLHYTSQASNKFSIEMNLMLMEVIRLGVIFSYGFQPMIREGDVVPQYSIANFIHELKKIFIAIDSIDNQQQKTKSDGDVIKAALKNIIDDEAWLDSVFGENDRPEAEEVREEKSGEMIDKTIIHNNTLNQDRTIIMDSASKKTDERNKDERFELLDIDSNEGIDKIKIMSSIDRILRQL